VSVVADDSSFPELFEHLRRQREAWGVRLIPWRNLREVFGVLKRGEMLGLLVDWGYRPDGVPVRLFDAWTTLPAGPAVLAAKTGATIVPVVVRRHPDGRFFVTHDESITVPSSDRQAIATATQRIADWLERTIAAAPEQWYSFKPIWPEEPAEVSRLAASAEETAAGS
jgi:KDO2-lipid IV(A) lauroyltransferase